MSTRVVLDPTSERQPTIRERPARLDSLDGRVVALLDISKTKGDVFLDAVERKLSALGVTVKRYQKPTFAKPAPVDLRQEIATNCDAAIEALAD